MGDPCPSRDDNRRLSVLVAEHLAIQEFISRHSDEYGKYNCGSDSQVAIGSIMNMIVALKQIYNLVDDSNFIVREN